MSLGQMIYEIFTIYDLVIAVWIVCGVAYATWWGYTTYRNKKQEKKFPALKFVHQKLKDRNIHPDDKLLLKNAKKCVFDNTPIIIFNRDNPENELFAFGSPTELDKKRHQIREENKKIQQQHIFLKQNSS